MAMTARVTFRTTPELKERINGLAEKTKRSPGFFYNILLENHIDDLEDVYDAIQIRERVYSGKEKTYPLEDIASEMGYEA